MTTRSLLHESLRLPGWVMPLLLTLLAQISPAGEAKHVVVYADPSHFCGWPANNGIWIWEGREILAGFTLGEYEKKDGHNIAQPIRTVFARSLDGGENWSLEDPENFVGDGGDFTESPGGIDFTHDGFVLRMMAAGYLVTDDTQGSFFYSIDRGHSWKGPYRLGSLAEHAELQSAESTPRTDYIVNGRDDCLLVLSARQPSTWGSDRVFCAHTTDGGATFDFVSWVVPTSDPYRAVMPATVRCEASKLVSAIRRRDFETNECWIDAYISNDNGKSWAFLSRVAETGARNGNPPALIRLRDGRLCCVYGNRSKRQVLYRYSVDQGASWGEECVLRDGYHSGQEDADFGYARVVERSDGKLLAAYYWASREHPQQHIAASTWNPGETP